MHVKCRNRGVHIRTSATALWYIIRMKIKALILGSSGACLLGALICGSQGSMAQTAAPAADQAAHWQEIERKLGVPRKAGQPWHLVISLKVFNEESHSAASGTFEESFGDPRHLHRTISLGAQSMHWWETPSGAWRSGSVGPEIKVISLIHHALVETGIPAHFVTAQNLQVDQRTIKGKALTCIAVAHLVDCYDGATLEYSQYPVGNAEFYFDNWMTFQDSQVARDLVIMRDGRKIASAHIEKLEELGGVDLAQLSPGKDAEPINPFSSAAPSFGLAGFGVAPPPRKINISAGVAQGLLSSHSAPVYPPVAKAAGVSGTVVLQATVSQTGNIEALHVVSGPALLQQAALDAVKSWTYRPYLLNGEPVEVGTTINVIFTLSQPGKAANSSGSITGDAEP